MQPEADFDQGGDQLMAELYLEDAFLQLEADFHRHYLEAYFYCQLEAVFSALEVDLVASSHCPEADF